MPPIWHQPLSSDNYQKPRIFFKYGSTYDRANIHHSSDFSCLVRFHIRSGRKAEPICHRISIYDDRWFFDVSRVSKEGALSLTKLLTFVRCISSTNPRVVYGGVFVVACAIYPAFPGVVTWLSNNLAGSYKRSAGMAIQIGVGNLGGAIASNFYRQRDSPRYILGHGLELGFIGAGIIAAFILVVAYATINKKRDKILREGGETRFTAEELSAQGDRAVTFRYMI